MSAGQVLDHMTDCDTQDEFIKRFTAYAHQVGWSLAYENVTFGLSYFEKPDKYRRWLDEWLGARNEC